MKNVLEYLEQSSLYFPNKTAIIDESDSCTYAELHASCQNVGTALFGKIKIGDPIIVLMEKGISALQAFWGTVYAGGCYVLINPELPSFRINQIQEVLEVKYVITDQPHYGLAQELFTRDSILLIDSLTEVEADYVLLKIIRDKMIDTDPLYANFTSGSTGTPKGVLVSHRSVIDFIDIFTETFGFSSDDIFGNQAPFDFDVSVKDIYSSIKLGSSLAIIPRCYFSHPMELLDLINEKKITVMIWAVSAICLINTFHGLEYKAPTTVKKVLFSGEVMPPKHLKSWMEHLPKTLFVNLYGPTEITCNCTYHIIDRNRDYSNGIPIGLPFPNEHVFLLNSEDIEVLAPDMPGEICIRGSALALGYYRNLQQTEAAFVQNPLNDKYPELIYRTGDLGRYLQNGELMFCGRKDFQIKYMGHRIELEEIECTISMMPDIDRCCCIFDSEKERLYGFYTGNADSVSLRKRLSQLLPVYMVPRKLCRIENFPLNKNGKIDRKALLNGKE